MRRVDEQNIRLHEEEPNIITMTLLLCRVYLLALRKISAMLAGMNPRPSAPQSEPGGSPGFITVHKLA